MSVPAASSTDALSRCPRHRSPGFVGRSVLGVTTEIKDEPIVSLASTARGWRVGLSRLRTSQWTMPLAFAVPWLRPAPCREADGPCASDRAYRSGLGFTTRRDTLDFSDMARTISEQTKTAQCADLEEPMYHATRTEPFSGRHSTLPRDDEVSIDSQSQAPGSRALSFSVNQLDAAHNPHHKNHLLASQRLASDSRLISATNALQWCTPPCPGISSSTWTTRIRRPCSMARSRP